MNTYTRDSKARRTDRMETKIRLKEKLAYLESVHLLKLGKLEMLQVYAKLGFAP